MKTIDEVATTFGLCPKNTRILSKPKIYFLADEEDKVATTFGPCPNLDNHLDPPKNKKNFGTFGCNWVGKVYILFLGS
jgi:hypothetical protein